MGRIFSREAQRSIANVLWSIVSGWRRMTALTAVSSRYPEILAKNYLVSTITLSS